MLKLRQVNSSNKLSNDNIVQYRWKLTFPRRDAKNTPQFRICYNVSQVYLSFQRFIIEKNRWNRYENNTKRIIYLEIDNAHA